MSKLDTLGKGFAKCFLETSPACLLNMVKGNLLAVTLHHWLVAFETGALAGIFWLILMLTPAKKFEDNKIFLFALVATADFILVAPHFDGKYAEAISTGITAVMIALVYMFIFKKWHEYKS